MKFTNTNFHGGDVQGYSISELPKGLKKLTGVAERIIARGETSGHAHILTGDVEEFVDEKTNIRYAVVGSDGAFHQHYKENMIKEETYNVKRNISNCDHTKECAIPEGVYVLGLDRQYDPNAEVWIQNKD
jgi:hypothetical protein